MTTTVDFAKVEREFVRSIRNEMGGDPITLAATPAFEEEPVPLEVFVREPRFLGLPALSPIQLDALRHAERVLYEPTFDALGWPKVRAVFELWLAWGKGSGKDYISRITLSRIAYLLLCLESPQAYFGMPGSETISLTNVATSALQARHVFFAPWVQMLKHSPWFRSRMEPGVLSIEFDKQVLALSGHSKSESQEGQNLLVAVLDEIAAFKTASELHRKTREQEREPEQSAEGIVKTLRSSIRSRFPVTGKLIGISFTRFKNDMIDQQVRFAEAHLLENPASPVYASRHATWEVNPYRKRADFADDYAKDANDARSRYECLPISSPYRFFQNLLAVRKCMRHALVGEPEQKRLEGQPEVRVFYEWMPNLISGGGEWQVSFDLTQLPRHRHPMSVHFDLGISHDLAGVAASHVEVKENGQPKVVTDFTLVLRQQAGDAFLGVPESDIQIRWVRELIIALMEEGFVVALVTGDGYQSTDTFQFFASRGIATELYSLDKKTEGYDILKSLVYASDVAVSYDPLLYAEIESLTKISDTKIDHQAGMSKDQADAWAGSVRGALKLYGEGWITAAAGASWGGGKADEQRREAEVAEAEERERVVAGAYRGDIVARPRLVGYDVSDDGDFWSG
jgi:hypothetical protein